MWRYIKNPNISEDTIECEEGKEKQSVFLHIVVNAKTLCNTQHTGKIPVEETDAETDKDKNPQCANILKSEVLLVCKYSQIRGFSSISCQ